jgi:hypothetical protein
VVVGIVVIGVPVVAVRASAWPADGELPRIGWLLPAQPAKNKETVTPAIAVRPLEMIGRMINVTSRQSGPLTSVAAGADRAEKDPGIK